MVSRVRKNLINKSDVNLQSQSKKSMVIRWKELKYWNKIAVVCGVLYAIPLLLLMGLEGFDISSLDGEGSEVVMIPLLPGILMLSPLLIFRTVDHWLLDTNTFYIQSIILFVSTILSVMMVLNILIKILSFLKKLFFSRDDD